jgi:hypothetical protein
VAAPHLGDEHEEPIRTRKRNQRKALVTSDGSGATGASLLAPAGGCETSAGDGASWQSAKPAASLSVALPLLMPHQPATTRTRARPRTSGNAKEEETRGPSGGWGDRGEGATAESHRKRGQHGCGLSRSLRRRPLGRRGTGAALSGRRRPGRGGRRGSGGRRRDGGERWRAVARAPLRGLLHGEGAGITWGGHMHKANLSHPSTNERLWLIESPAFSFPKQRLMLLPLNRAAGLPPPPSWLRLAAAAVPAYCFQWEMLLRPRGG